jgi:glycerol-3-phosphate dehydrogenase
VHGGAIEDIEAHVREARSRRPREVPEPVFESLVRAHGTAYDEVLAPSRDDARLLERVGATDVLAAEVAHAVRREMAVRLTDVVCRRTELGTESAPAAEALERCAAIMAREAGWSDERRAREIEETRAAFRHDSLEARTWN